MIKKEKYRVVGLMSGTSLDGLDIVSCSIWKEKNDWNFTIHDASTIRYNAHWRTRLADAFSMNGIDLVQTDVEFGRFLATACVDFISKTKTKPDFIASHGHTVFHQPQKGVTLQIGNGNAIHALTKLPVVCDFRSLDVLRGGQGAPLVPIGDKLLFAEYDVCLNLGGIANLSLEHSSKRIAFDVCFANMGLNYVAEKIGKEYDRNGVVASRGEVKQKFLKKLSAIYSRLKSERPSLGREIFESRVKPLLDDKTMDVRDVLCSFTESIAREVVETVRMYKKRANVLCTGGGAFNSFLLARMLEHGGDDITFVVPDEQIVKFKEALIFAFLGVLRVRDENNCLKSVTKASMDSSSGILVGF